MGDSGKLCWTNKPAFSAQHGDASLAFLSSLYHHFLRVTLPGLESGPMETGRNVVILVYVLLPRCFPMPLKLGLELIHQHLCCLMVAWRLLG